MEKITTINKMRAQGLIPVLSTNVIGQNNHPSFDLQHLTSGSLVNVQGMKGNKELKTPDIYAELNPRQAHKNLTSQQRSLIQIYDSIHSWQWDTLSIGWKIESKIINIVYDASNNLTSYLSQNWNGSTWENDYQMTYTYDANNFTISKSSKEWDYAGTVVTYGDSSYYYFHTVLGINDLMLPLETISVYPNPASTTITISIPFTSNKNTFMTIYNISGQVLLSRQITEQQNGTPQIK